MMKNWSVWHTDEFLNLRLSHAAKGIADMKWIHFSALKTPKIGKALRQAYYKLKLGQLELLDMRFCIRNLKVVLDGT